MSKDKKQKEKFPHFRWYKKAKHPALIVAEHSEDEYDFKKVTHSKNEGRHLNDAIIPNPNKNDKKPMYVVRRKRHDKKNTFGVKLPWEYPKKK